MQINVVCAGNIEYTFVEVVVISLIRRENRPGCRVRAKRLWAKDLTMTTKPTYRELEQRIAVLEKKLAESRENRDSFGLTHQYLEAILNNTNLPIYLKDVDYKYILVNREYERLARVTSDQIRGLDDFAIFPDPVARLFREQDEEVVRRRSMIEFEETIPLPDGVHTFWTAKFPIIDEDGRIAGVGGVCTDITAHKKAEALFRRTFDQSPIGAAMVGLDYRFFRVNDELCRITGYTAEELLQLGFPEITYHEDLDKDLEYARKLERGEIEQYQIDKRYVRKNGELVWVRLSVRLICDEEGKPSFYLPMMKDIHERKLAEAALQKAHAQLEQRVIERTAELDRRTRMLAETNVALKILLEKRAEDKRELEAKVMFNVEKLILPYLEKLKANCPEQDQQDLLTIIRTNLEEITSSFDHIKKNTLARLTPTQLQVADLVKQGLTSKEIASLLNLSPSTIACHRQEIRKKLSLSNKKINLQSALTNESY